MELMFIILKSSIGLISLGLILLISGQVNNKRLACVLCYFVGVAATLGTMFLLIHSGDAASIGLI